MEHFAQLKRRTTDLLQSLPETTSATKASLSNVFAGHGRPAVDDNTLKGTWQRVAIPALPRSSHSIDVVAGTAYVFGGEGLVSRKPVDNDVHAIVLPTGSAGADYYAIKAVPAKKPLVPEAPKLTISEPEPESDPVQISEPQAVDADAAEPVEEKASIDKGKGKEKEDEAKPEEPEEPTEVAVEEIELPTTPLGNVPEPRVGHATAVIGSRIFMFGGRGGPDMTPLQERGRVWVFDTKTHTWSFLDPLAPAVPVPIKAVSSAAAAAATTVTMPPAASGTTRPIFPTARSYHSAVATEWPTADGDAPGSIGRKPKRTASWKEWVEGDRAEVGIPQRPIVGNIAARARDADSDGYGTFIIHGGCLAGGGRANDVWLFDVRTRIWEELPAAPGLPRGGTSLCLSHSRLYRFGGFNGSTEEGGRLDYLQLALSTLDDSSVDDADVMVVAAGGWESVYPEKKTEGASEGASEGAEPAVGDTVPLASDVGEGGSTATADNAWPGDRSVSSLEAITLGGGWDYLVLALGERSPSGSGHEAAGTFWSDVWAFQVPPHSGLSAASVSNAVRSVLPRRLLFGGGAAAGAGAGRWSRVVTAPYDDDDDTAGAGEDFGPGARGWIASSPMRELEENGIVIFGGLNDKNQRLDDVWIFRLGGETRE